MNFIRLYARVLKLLGDESRLGWMLAIANVSLAAAQFAEPVLFGRIVDTLAGAQSRGGAPMWTDLITLLAAWVSFGLFTITCGALVALHADRLAHPRRPARFAARSCRPSPPARGDDEHLRAYPATAAQFPRRHPFRPADEGDADRNGFAVVAMAPVFSRASRRRRCPG